MYVLYPIERNLFLLLDHQLDGLSGARDRLPAPDHIPTIPCDRCRQPAARFSNAERVAIDLDLDRPTLLLITVSVHFCVPCRHYFRAQPPFLHPDASYTNRVVATAVAAVYNDRM